MRRAVELDLQLQSFIDAIPERYGDPYKVACSADGVTVDSWKDIWIKNYSATKEHFGELGGRSYGQLFGINRYKPAIVCGSGPSLKRSIDALRQNRAAPNPILTISCLHNFGYFEDEGCHADYYLTLDAGEIILKDVYEGRAKDPEFYWAQTEGKTLLANICTPVSLFEKWKGEVYLFNTLMPDVGLRQAFDGIERMSHFISTGGNALGGCMYTAKAIMGSCEIIYVGADFCFDWEQGNDHWHSYSTQYDDFKGNGKGTVYRWPNIYGVPAYTWPSYLNFKFWFDWVSMAIPGRYASASEGILGAYAEGNLRSFRYGPLADLLQLYWMADVATLQDFRMENGKRVPVLDASGALVQKQMGLSEMFKDPKQPLDITLF